LFFYDGPISQAVAFEKLLSNGQNFANRLLSGFNDDRPWAQLVHIATDGETYGHHYAHGDMALAYALDYIERNQLASISNYGEYLAKQEPPTPAFSERNFQVVSTTYKVLGDCLTTCKYVVGGRKTGGRNGWTGRVKQ